MDRQCIKKLTAFLNLNLVLYSTLNWFLSHFWQFQHLTTEYISDIYRELKNYNLECKNIEFGQVLKSAKYDMKNISVNLINVGSTFAKTIST